MTNLIKDTGEGLTTDQLIRAVALELAVAALETNAISAFIFSRAESFEKYIRTGQHA